MLDQWIEKHQGKAYDKNGEWAASGQVNSALLAALLDEDFFQLPPPKSTGRELFNLAWLENKIQKIAGKTTALLPQDVQATLAEFTVQSIVLALNNIQTILQCRLLVCGGGAKNQAIMSGLKQALSNWRIQLTTELDLDIDYVEAAAFAWLAYRRMHNLPANLPSVTGATSAVSLGAIFSKE